MFFIRYNNEGEVIYTHAKPELLDDESKKDGVLVESIPDPQLVPGKMPVLCYDSVDKTLYYKQIDRPLAPEDQLYMIQQETKIDVILAQKELDVRNRIASGEITATTFPSLSAEDKELVTLVLFKDYSPSKEEVPKALSAVEFGLVVLFKLLGKAIDRTKLSAEEQQYLDAMLSTINLNDMPINDTTDWRYQYFHQQFEKTQQNRQEYYNAKMAVTGTW